MTTISQEKCSSLDIAIVGGGICGLTCAIALARRGIYAHVYEAAAKFGEIGTAIGIGRNAISVLEEIGIFGDVMKKVNASEEDTRATFLYFSGFDGHELIYDYPTGPEEGGLGVARSLFLDALVDHIDSQYAHFNKRCTTVTSGVRPTVHFSDGTSVEADVVLLASGIKGSGREIVTGTNPKNHVAFSNSICYRAVVSAAAALAAGARPIIAQRPTCYMGLDKHVILVPIQGGKLVGVAAFAINHSLGIGEENLPDGQPTVVPVTKQEVVSTYEGWGPDVLGTLSCMQSPNKWSINVVHPSLETYVKGRVALVGDAAHAMLPHVGSGAGQGIEDVYLLAQLLSHPDATAANIKAILEVYDTVRRPRAQAVWERSLLAGRIYEGHGEHGASHEGRRHDLTGLMDFVWHHKPDEDYQASLKLLRERRVFRA